MLTNDALGRALVAIVGIVNVVLLLPVLVIQLVEFVQRRGTGEPIQRHRLATATFVLAMEFFLCWRLLIWADVAIWDGALLGPTAGRWRVDLVIGTTILLLTSVLIAVFWWDRWYADSGRSRIDTATLITVAMGGVRD